MLKVALSLIGPLFLAASLFGATESEIDNLIVQLDSENYSVRESATKDLLKIGIPAINKLKSIDNNLEVWYVTNYIIKQYYSLLKEDMVNIWYLPREIRFKNGEDISLKYYMISFNNLMKDHSYIYYSYQECCLDATKLFFKDLLDNNQLEIALDIHNKMINFDDISDTMSEANHSIYSQFYVGGYDVPRPIEDRIVDAYKWDEALIEKNKEMGIKLKR